MKKIELLPNLDDIDEILRVSDFATSSNNQIFCNNDRWPRNNAKIRHDETPPNKSLSQLG